jgi:hypothetical protein
VAVKVLACPVVAHGRARIGVAGGDLDIAQVHPRIEHRGDERVAEHMRMRPGDRHPCSLGKAAQAAGCRVTVHPGTAAVEQDRPANAAAGRRVDGPPDRWRQRDQDDLAALATYAQHSVAVFFTQVGDVGAGGLEDPQAK